MSTLSLRFPTGSSQIGGFDSLAKTLQACSKVAATLEHGQRLQNLSERLFFIQKPANAHLPDPDQEAQPHMDFSSTGRPRRTSSIHLSKLSGKRSDSPRKSQNAVKLSSIFNDDFSPTALLSASNINNTVEIPLDELFAPDATDSASPVAKPVVSTKRTTSSAAPSLKRSSSTTAVQSTPGTSVNAADIAGVNGKAMCANCGATHTPLWRRGLNDELNCNACGLYCKLHKRPRPKVMKISSVASPRPQTYTPPPSETPVATVSAVCHNCKTTTTPLWRKNDAGQNVCNACGLYHKLHGEARPVSMKSDVVRKRSRQETTARAPKAMPPPQREYTKAAPTGLKVNTTPVSYERSSSLSAGATPRKGSFASDDDDDDLERKEREAAAMGLKLSEIQLLQSTLHELQRRGDVSTRNSEYGDMTDGEGYGSDEAHSRKRRRQEDEEYEPYERRPSYDARARARLGSDYGRPSPLRQMVDGTGETSYGQPVYAQERAHSPFSASSSESSSPRTVERDLPMSRPYSPVQTAVSADGYYMHGYFSKDVNPAYSRIPSAYDYDWRSGSVPRKYRRSTAEMV